MNEKSLRILEYNKIIDMLVSYAGSALGKEMCRSLLPSSNLSEITHDQAETTAALTRILRSGNISFGGIREVRGSMLRLRVGGSLGIVELMNIAGLLETAGRVKSFGRGGHSGSDDVPPDCLSGYFDLLEPVSGLSREIRRCIIDEENIADDATPGLKAVRRSIKLANEKIHSQLSAMLTSRNLADKLQEAIITTREGRYCLPVKAEHRSSVPGMIHDQSSSGSTVFIEPMAVVKLNNDLRELAAKEKEEINHVLDLLSEQASQSIQVIEQDQEILTRLDFIFAKAALSRSYNGSEPVFTENGGFNIKKGRHPLLDKKKVVAIDISVTEENRMLIITGPNTGGKTVSLKTVGLFHLMGQAGLHIPAFEGSTLSLFTDIFADIGDEQSIEQNLSTFSSHMTNIVGILSEADPGTLVLFDELCAGTDPTEGAALAMAILSDLLARGVCVLATTHYSELKIFAMTTPGVLNACCEFNVETLSPTYRLLIGIPGKSNAFAISGKLGLPEDIIESAKGNIDIQQQSFEDMLGSLEKSRIEIEKEQEEISALREEAASLTKKLESRQESLEKQKGRILSEAKEEARSILQNAKDYADETIRKMNKLASGKGIDMKALEQQRSGLREELGKYGSSVQSRSQKRNKDYSPSDFKRGDTVNVLSMNLKGTVVSEPNSKGEIMVQMGVLKSRISYKDLAPLYEEDVSAPDVKRDGSGKLRMEKSTTISTSLNLIGKTVDEALGELDKYLDDAYLSHIPQVTIIHGRGTGKLKKAVQDKLHKTKYVKKYRLGQFGEGGDGVTIVDFEK
ncbi:MAG: endonuclease MutS2 [Lachnospiraceae bacterium]|nr:endonuclease MutS2 [Lachnospiraceae bacterium]